MSLGKSRRNFGKGVVTDKAKYIWFLAKKPAKRKICLEWAR